MKISRIILLTLTNPYSIVLPVRNNIPQKSSPQKLGHLKDDAWIRSHFRWLIDRYPGQYVVVAEGEAFIGPNVARLERQARERHPHAITTGMPIPRPDDFSAILHVYP